ncbi:TPA: hypothetical protein ACRR6V_002402 [Enterobacter hormaechei]
MSNIDKHAVQAVADLKAGYTLGHADVAILNELARIVLASLEAEPVAWLLSGGGAKNHVSFDSGNAYADPLREVTPLYTAPPAPVSVPDLKPVGFLFVSDDGSVAYSPADWPMKGFNLIGQIYGDLNACRAAMLQGAENGESPTTMQTAPALDSSPKIAESPSGNSPVIPDGWVMVPVEPTPDMREAYHQAQAEYEDSDGLWSPDHQWQAMLAAAPQQEVKP